MEMLLVNSRDFVAYIVEILSSFGNIRLRSMFGGHGIYKDEVFFAIISDDTLYFKVNGTNLVDYQTIDSVKFSYRSNGELKTMSYWSVPIDCLEDNEKLAVLVNGSYNAGLTSKKSAKVIKGQMINDKRNKKLRANGKPRFSIGQKKHPFRNRKPTCFSTSC